MLRSGLGVRLRLWSSRVAKLNCCHSRKGIFECLLRVDLCLSRSAENGQKQTFSSGAKGWVARSFCNGKIPSRPILPETMITPYR